MEDEALILVVTLDDLAQRLVRSAEIRPTKEAWEAVIAAQAAARFMYDVVTWLKRDATRPGTQPSSSS